MNAPSVRRFAPLAIALAIVAVAWFLFVQPRQSAADRAAAEVRGLQPRVDQLARLVEGPGVAAGDGPAADVIRRLPQVDPMPDVVERLSRLALAGSNEADVRYLLIETGEQAVAGGDGPGQPRATHAGEPDPRVALFGMPLAYTPVTVSFESTYERLGRFLWDMRELPTIVEVHSLTVEPAADGGARLKTKMVLFVYRRIGQDPLLATNARGPS
ncbi:MAG: type 4a pilus biogenesis protein PilO [Vicinamibacterales bacterium]